MTWISGSLPALAGGDGQRAGAWTPNVDATLRTLSRLVRHRAIASAKRFRASGRRAFCAVLLTATLALASCGGNGASPGPVTSPPATPFALANPFAIPGATSVDQVRIDELRVSGDSYSQEGFGRTTTWPMVLRAEGTVTRTEVDAVGGASASLVPHNNLAGQIDRFEAADSPIGDGDLTIVHFGDNDLGRDPEVVRAGYEAGVDRLTRDRRLGIAVGRYGSATDTILSAARLSPDQLSDGRTVY